MYDYKWKKLYLDIPIIYRQNNFFVHYQNIHVIGEKGEFTFLKLLSLFKFQTLFTNIFL